MSKRCTACMVMLLALQGIAGPQDTPKLVETGVIFSAQQVERSDEMNRFFKGLRPLWTPSPGEVTQLEGRLKPYLEDVANGKQKVCGYGSWRAPVQAKIIVARFGSYKRPYFGFAEGSKRWIL